MDKNSFDQPWTFLSFIESIKIPLIFSFGAIWGDPMLMELPNCNWKNIL